MEMKKLGKLIPPFYSHSTTQKYWLVNHVIYNSKKPISSWPLFDDTLPHLSRCGGRVFRWRSLVGVAGVVVACRWYVSIFFLKTQKPQTFYRLRLMLFWTAAYLYFTALLGLCTACGGMKVTNFLLPSMSRSPYRKTWHNKIHLSQRSWVCQACSTWPLARKNTKAPSARLEAFIQTIYQFIALFFSF